MPGGGFAGSVDGFDVRGMGAPDFTWTSIFERQPTTAKQTSRADKAHGMDLGGNVTLDIIAPLVLGRMARNLATSHNLCRLFFENLESLFTFSKNRRSLS